MAVNAFLCGVNVLILHQHFHTPYSGGAIRSYYLASALVKSGINVTVISGSNQDNYSIVNVDGIEVHYLPIRYENSYGFLKRGISFLLYVRKAVALALRLRKFDLCYAISVPLTVGLAAMRLKKKLGMPYIFEVGDSWPAAPIEMGFVKASWLKKYLLNLEKKIYKNAQSVIALSDPIAQAITIICPMAEVHVIPNMADTEYYRPEQKEEKLVSKFELAGKFVISYIGALGFANGLDHFINFAAATKAVNLPVQFLIVGDGAMRNRLDNRISNEGITNVSLLKFSDRAGVREVLNVTDACFVSYLPFKILETGSPNKYFDGLAAGKLIITNFGGWIREEIAREAIGFSVSNDPQEFVAKLNIFLADRALVDTAKKNARGLAERKYSRTLLSEKFVQLITLR